MCETIKFVMAIFHCKEGLLCHENITLSKLLLAAISEIVFRAPDVVPAQASRSASLFGKSLQHAEGVVS